MLFKFMNALLLTSLLFLFRPVYAGDYVVQVNGIVCSFCAQGVTKKLSKLPFIDSSKYTKGVKVEIESQKVTVAVREDVKIDVPSLYEAIRSGGYDPVDIWKVLPSGELEEVAGDGDEI